MKKDCLSPPETGLEQILERPLSAFFLFLIVNEITYPSRFILGFHFFSKINETFFWKPLSDFLAQVYLGEDGAVEVYEHTTVHPNSPISSDLLLDLNGSHIYIMTKTAVSPFMVMRSHRHERSEVIYVMLRVRHWCISRCFRFIQSLKPDVSIHQTECELSIIVSRSRVCPSVLGAAVNPPEDKRRRGEKEKRTASWQLRSGVTRPAETGKAGRRMCKVRRNNGIDQQKWPPLSRHAPCRECG